MMSKSVYVVRRKGDVDRRSEAARDRHVLDDEAIPDVGLLQPQIGHNVELKAPISVYISIRRPYPAATCHR